MKTTRRSMLGATAGLLTLPLIGNGQDENIEQEHVLDCYRTISLKIIIYYSGKIVVVFDNKEWTEHSVVDGWYTITDLAGNIILKRVNKDTIDIKYLEILCPVIIAKNSNARKIPLNFGAVNLFPYFTFYLNNIRLQLKGETNE